MIRLFVSNIAFDVVEADLEAVLLADGLHPTNVRICTDRRTGSSRGFGFVELDGIELAEAIAKLNGVKVLGRRINVKEAEPERAAARSGR